MEVHEVLTKFLNKNEISFTDNGDSVFLEEMGVEIPCDVIPAMKPSVWTTLAMEIGLKKIGNLITELKKCEGARIYEFRKKDV